MPKISEVLPTNSDLHQIFPNPLTNTVAHVKRPLNQRKSCSAMLGLTACFVTSKNIYILFIILIMPNYHNKNYKPSIIYKTPCQFIPRNSFVTFPILCNLVLLIYFYYFKLIIIFFNTYFEKLLYSCQQIRCVLYLRF